MSRSGSSRRDVYTHGHQESVLRGHRWRTAENSAAYLLDHLAPGQRLLDVGCGPGTITLDLADRVATTDEPPIGGADDESIPSGTVMGLETSEEILTAARAAAAERNTANVRWVVGDVYELDYDDDTFDVTHAHQVLQHLSDPRAALAEMRRVTRPGGLVAVRDADYHGMTWAPADPRLDRWMELYQAVARRNDGEPDAGRFLLEWAQGLGFADCTPSGSLWVFATDTDRAWWGGQWKDRSLSSSFAEQAESYGLASRAELEEVSAAFVQWAVEPAGWFTVPHGELLLRV